jgi:hypothetical protein
MSVTMIVGDGSGVATCVRNVATTLMNISSNAANVVFRHAIDAEGIGFNHAACYRYHERV